MLTTAQARIHELTEQLHELKAARRREQALHEEMTWAAQALTDSLLKGDPSREWLVKLAEGLNRRLTDYYKARDEANETEHGQIAS